MLRAALLLLIVTAAVAQTASPEAQALQALVTEIRQLRQEMQSTTVVTQRVQIVLYRLQLQTALTTSAASRLDDARTSLGKVQSETKRIAGYIPMVEEEVKSAQDPAQRKAKEENLSQVKINLERSAADEQRLQSRQIDAETQFRAEQGKLADLQDQLDRLDKLLDSLTRKQP
jgi:chromosome segregation ATPase